MDNDYVAMLQEENAQLREQVARLERALGGDFLAPLEWQLTMQETRLFGALLARDVMSRDAAMAMLYRSLGKDEAGPKIIDVFISKIRKKLRPFGVKIETLWGVGFRLAPDSRAMVKAQLQ